MADDPAACAERDDGPDGLWARLSETLVGARLVVVDQELLDHSLQVAGAKDEQVIEHLAPAGADEPWSRTRRSGVDGRRRRAVVEVKDGGPGVPASMREGIFEPFLRVDKHIGGTGGTGLGLSISRRLEGAHDGTLTLAETGAPGATFMLTLPGPTLEFAQQLDVRHLRDSALNLCTKRSDIASGTGKGDSLIKGRQHAREDSSRATPRSRKLSAGLTRSTFLKSACIKTLRLGLH